MKLKSIKLIINISP